MVGFFGRVGLGRIGFILDGFFRVLVYFVDGRLFVSYEVLFVRVFIL